MTALEKVVLKSKLAPRTKKIYLAAVQSFEAFVGEQPPCMWKKYWNDATVAAWRKSRKGLNPKTLNLELTAIRYVFNKVWIKLNVRPLPEKKKAVVKNLTSKEITRLFGTCRKNTPADMRDQAIIDLMLFNRMRRDEIASLIIAFSKHSNWTSWLQDQGINTGYMFRSLGRSNVEGVQKIGKRLTPDAIYKIIRARGKKAGLEISPDMLRRGSR